METRKPISRDAALVPLSREHHFGLLLVWKIRRGIALKIELKRVSDYTLYFYGAELLPHFLTEEQTIFPLLEPGHQSRLQAETDHASIRKLVAAIETNRDDAGLLKEFADVLEKHIRFEERVLFNEVQELIANKHLVIEVATVAANDADVDLGWADRFWMPGTPGN